MITTIKKTFPTVLSVFILIFLTGIGYRKFVSFNYPQSVLLFHSTELQNRLVNAVKKAKLSKAVSSKRLSVSVMDITSPDVPRYAGLNDAMQMYGASIPKILILLAYYMQIEEGKLEFSQPTAQIATKMIRYSSNRAANKMISIIGGNYITNLALRPELNLYNPDEGGGLWLGKGFNGQPAWHRDPIDGLSHAISTRKLVRFYHMLLTNNLLPKKYAKSIKWVLSYPGIYHKFVRGILEPCPKAKMLRKSGSWANFHSDSAVIEHHGMKYIISASSKSKHGSMWLTRLVRQIDKEIVDLNGGSFSCSY